MRVDLFDFELPRERIATRPAVPRDAARLLVIGERLDDRYVRDLPELLRPGDILVLNDTKVVPARLSGRRGEAAVEVTLTQPLGPERWSALARPAKRLRPGDTVSFGEGFEATVESREGGEVRLRFALAGEALRNALERFGAMPLPPYIARPSGADERDRRDYQTVFGRHEGAVAAPTAGLHFTEALFDRLSARGIGHAFVTLHVGPGTFLPVTADDTGGHRMHAEHGSIGQEAADAVNDAAGKGCRVIAVGSTSLRVLETASNQDGVVAPFDGEIDLFVVPGYRFKRVDALLTNFHLPCSTLFMLVAAFGGLDRMKRAYAHAIEAGYRFYSYGDACLIFPEGR
ncbi:MAG: tRNA preQ1(34) S-adenosylmethionine ribosyltransferase-isomerase QueA [Alphaproteobacteria bacterium]